MKLRREWRIFIYLHIGFLAALLLFPLYRFFVDQVPRLLFGCVLHDRLFLYCPLCGGTRAIEALLQLDLPLALAQNTFVVLLVFLCLILDFIALVRLLQKKAVILWIPQWCWLAAAISLLLWGVFRNFLMIVFGVDPTGDLGAIWQRLLGAFLS